MSSFAQSKHTNWLVELTEQTSQLVIPQIVGIPQILALFNYQAPKHKVHYRTPLKSISVQVWQLLMKFEQVGRLQLVPPAPIVNSPQFVHVRVDTGIMHA